MKKMNTLMALLLLLFMWSTASAQVSSYAFSGSSGTYTEISGGTVLGTTTSDDQVFNNSTTGAAPPVTNTGFPIGFNFVYNGITYDKFAVNNNGWIILGTGSFTIGASSGNYTPLSTTGPVGYVSAISALGLDLQGQTGSELSFLSSGGVLTIQWKNYRYYLATGDIFNFQIKLYETGNKVEFVYGSFTKNATDRTPQVGLRGATNADYNNRTTISNWASTSAGSSNAATCALTSSVYPAGGQTFAWQMADMSYVSSTTTQPVTGAIPKNTSNNIIVQVQVEMYGTLNPLQLSSITFNTGNTTLPATDVTNAKLWTTGTNPVFTGATQLGNTIPALVAGDFTFNSGTGFPYTMLGGTNYFWLTYDVPAGATAGNFADADCNSLTIGTPKTPTVTNPGSGREIKSPLSGAYTIDNTNPTGGTNYNSFTAAVSDLNTLGIAGPVTFNVFADQTFSMTCTGSPSYALVISTSGTATWPIIFQKYNTGANPILMVTGTSGTSDVAVFFNGADYLTFDGINITDAGTGATNYLERGYYLSGPVDNNCKYVTIKNCTIDLTKANTSSYGIWVSANAPTSTDNANHHNLFYDNTIQDCYYGYYIYGNSSFLDTYNEIGTSGVTRTSKVTNFAVYGIYANYQTNFKIFNTDIYNTSYSSTGSVYGIFFSSSAITATVEIFKNYIYDLTSTSTSSTMYGMYLAASAASYDVYNNKVYNLTVPYNLHGIYIGMGSTNRIYNNQVYNVNCSGVSYIAYGITVAGGTTNYVYNNMISDIRNVTGTSSPSVRALSIQGGTNDYVYYNTVYLKYTSTAASNSSAALYVTTTPTSVELKNNIFVNEVNVSTGARAVAHYRSSTALTNFALTSDNNLYYAGTPSAKNLLYYDGTNSDQLLTAYKARMSPREQAAKTEIVPFENITTTPYNLKIQTTTATQVESGGVRITTPIEIKKDFEDDWRYGEPEYTGTGQAPDLGADEFNGIPLDITPPTITYSLLGNSTSTTTYPFNNVVITDINNVNGGTDRPRVYYKKSTQPNAFNTNDNTTDGWKYKEAEGSVSPFNFIIDYGKTFGGVAAGDVMQYFVVAQDMASTPNVGINAGSFAATPTSVNLTAAAFPIGGTLNSYNIASPVTGEYLVGTGQTYTSLTADATTGFFKYVNSNLLTGNVTVKIVSDLTETGAVALNQWTEEGAGNYTLTIIPHDITDVTNKTISGNYAGNLIRLNGTDRVTIDGTGDKALTFTNTNTGSHRIIGLLNGASSNTITNCKFVGSSISASYGIGFNNGNNNNNTISNNAFSKMYYAISMNGLSTAYDNGNQILNNTIGSTVATDYVTLYGVYGIYQNNLTIHGNEIFSMIHTSANYGVYNEASTNVVIEKNMIHDIIYTGTGGYGPSGITIKPNVANPNIRISNNVIYHIAGDSDTPNSSDFNYIPAGIKLFGTSTSGVYIYYNSIYLTPDPTYGVKYNDNPNWNCGIEVGASISGIVLKNNIIRNSLGKNSTMTNPAYGYAIYCKSATSPFAQIDNNIYYTTNFDQNWVGLSGTVQPPTTSMDFTAWKAFTGQDNNSKNEDPLYTDLNNLLPATGSPAIGAGIPLPGIVDDDILDVPRSGSNPTIGAYEVPFASDRTLNLTVFLEGLWNGTDMNEAQDDMGSHWGAGIADHIFVELRDGDAPHGSIYGPIEVELSTSGIATLTVPQVHNQDYYIAITHRNSIETWSGTAIWFNTSPINYNFTDAASRAFGNNLQNLGGGVYGIFGGDVNLDWVVDSNDLGDVDNDSNGFVFGYVATDANGDGIVDSNDLGLVDNNANGFVMAILP